MMVPSHNLYDFVHQATEKRFWIKYFHPWGEKDLMCAKDYIESIDQLNGPTGIPKHRILIDQIFTNSEHWTVNRFSRVRNFQPILFCHDQEPLNFNLYNDGQLFMQSIEEFCKSRYDFPVSGQNLRTTCVWSWQKSWVLLHSELNSSELENYQRTGRYVGAYWWSHAMLARDWYRYAEVDRALDCSDLKKLFLIYSRDTTGTRQYRQKFLDSIIPIQNHCQIGSFIESEINSTSSAVYDCNDFYHSGISIVLETLFDDARIHLTEKTLRPIACGHPFMVAAGPGSLALLKKYGFETFSPWIDERYDLEQDHHRRLQMISNEMKRLSMLSDSDRDHILDQCRIIAKRNKHYFFSDQFYHCIVDELSTNVKLAEEKCQALDPGFYLSVKDWRKKHNPDLLTKTRINRPDIVPFARYLRQNQGSFKQYQRHKHGLDNKSSANGNDV